MSASTKTESRTTMADLLRRLGGVGPERVLMTPTPGTATEADLLRLVKEGKCFYELIEGTLVEKVMGYNEAGLAMWIGRLLGRYLDVNDLGELIGADGTVRLLPGLVRIPDVAFTRHENLPPGGWPEEAIPDLVPDLAIEVLSRSNTDEEMELKTKDYFLAGVTLVWLVDPRTRTVTVFTSPDESREFGVTESLDGGDVLPGLVLPVRQIFERLPAPVTKPVKGKRKPKA